MSDSEYALQARLEAKPEKIEEVAEFLESVLPAAEAEVRTTTWFALRLDETAFGISDTVPDEEGRQAQLDEIDVLAATHS